jgi:D-sedoheptulose 7-phosphate isomerase
MDLIKHVAAHFTDSAELKKRVAVELAEPIVKAGETLTQCFLNNGKVLACGNGGSASDAMHFAGEMVGRLERERPGLPAIALSADSSVMTALGNDYDYEQVFAKQVMAFGNPGDVLLALTTSGNSPNVLAAVAAAHERDMTVIALSGKNGGELAHLLKPGDVELRVPHNRTMRIQEIHITMIHAMCDLVDIALLGEPV